MILNWQLTVAVLGGAAVGLGVFLVVREAVPATPALGPALRRLHQPTGHRPAHRARRRGGWTGSGLARWLRPPHRQLALLDQTPEQYALSLLLSALVGLAAPTCSASRCSSSAVLAAAGRTGAGQPRPGAGLPRCWRTARC